MLTIFAIPRAFHGHFGVIQRNAIVSWTRLDPQPEIILFGNDAGTGDICRELGLRHIPELGRTSHGAPCLSDLFRKARESTRTDWLCYVNSDIILLRDFTEAVQRSARLHKKSLMVARRWDIFLDRLWDFEAENAAEDLRERVLREGRQGPLPGNSDFFVYPRDLWSSIPDFGIGRGSWDAWLVYEARRLDAAVVDASTAVAAIHQSHDQSAYPHGLRRWRAELDANREIAGDDASRFCLYDATYLLTPEGFRRPMGLSYFSRRVDTLPLFYPGLSLPAQIPRLAISAVRAIKRKRAEARDPLRSLKALVRAKLPKSGITSILGLSDFTDNEKGHAVPQGLQLAHCLVWGGFPVVVYDPRPAAMERARQILTGPVEFAASAEQCIRGGDLVVIAAPCPEFMQIPAAAFSSDHSKRVIIDCCDSVTHHSVREGLQYIRCPQPQAI